ncbi:hypothetical protein HFO51_06335 [Rhizobium leguminosarum]|uniref:hypothetical protein n=1 Tax=Rhizobium leguminosarum TaxID=384 RepID=UPI001C964BBF|nr:hypothetical protein [Rhizobium leguminosarum]MBY5594085.1 hypothetical protein [Rhizobium leguminosarum]
MSQSIFNTYCSYILAQSGAASGRYDKDDLQTQVMRMPHGKITMIARDIMVENLSIVPEDVSLKEWANRVLGGALVEKEWVNEPFMIEDKHLRGLKDWPEWVALDATYMPLGLQPCINYCGDLYQYRNKPYNLVDMRFLPLVSYEYRKA